MAPQMSGTSIPAARVKAVSRAAMSGGMGVGMMMITRGGRRCDGKMDRS
jgi:hypothetical protein